MGAAHTKHRHTVSSHADAGPSSTVGLPPDGGQGTPEDDVLPSQEELDAIFNDLAVCSLPLFGR